MGSSDDQNGRRRVKRIGGFVVLSRVGRGGMGAVYKARQISMNRLVALKILPRDRASSETYVQRFLREARSAAQLSHANIVQAIDVGKADGYYYFAMEFVDGETVQALLDREGKLDEKRALSITTAVTRALRHAHRHGIVHRDIKPGNIMIDRHGEVKLADLGLARSVERIDTVTVDGIGVGTPHYMAPEQARGETDVDTRADIYALGATLYHMLTGETPFDGPTAAVVAAKHITEPMPSPRDRNPALSQGVSRLIRRMMSKSPAARPQNPEQLLGEIEDVLEGRMRIRSESAAHGHGDRHHVRRRRKRSHALTWLVVAGVLAAGAGAVIALGRWKPDRTETVSQDDLAKAAYDAAERLRTERPDDTLEALAAFQAVVRRYPGTEWAGRAAIRAEELERLDRARVAEAGKTDPSPPEPAPDERGTAEDVAALQAQCAALCKEDKPGAALDAIAAFIAKHPEGESAQAAKALRTETLALADERYATLVHAADAAAARGDYAQARGALKAAAALGIPHIAEQASALLPDLAALETRAAEEAKWEQTHARAVQLTEDGAFDQALEVLQLAKDLQLRDIEARITEQNEIVEAARREATNAAVAAYAGYGDKVQSLLAERRYDDADAVLATLTGKPELALAADHIAADVEAVKLLRALWVAVERGIAARKGKIITVGNAGGAVVGVQNGVVTLSANNAEFTVNILKLPARQALSYAAFEDRAVAARARVVLLLAERVDLDRVPAALAAAGDTPHAAIYRARLDALRGAAEGNESEKLDAEAKTAWARIGAFASPKLTASRAKQLIGMLDRFAEQYKGTATLASVEADLKALRARAVNAADVWVKIYDGKSLNGWSTMSNYEGASATVRKDGALEVVGSRKLLHALSGQDVAVRARVRRTGYYSLALHLRASADGDNGYYGWYDGTRFGIGKLVDGTGTTLVSSRSRGPRKDVVDLMFAAVGSSLALTADGEVVARAKDTAFKTGRVGIGVGKRTTALFGRIEARVLDRPSLPKPPPGKWVRLFDGKTLRGWTPLGQPDPKLGNAVRVRDGSLEMVGSTQLVHALAAANVEMRVRIRKTQGQSLGLWLRRSKSGNYSVWFDGAKFSIGKTTPEAGYASLAAADAPEGPAPSYAVVATASGSTVTVTVDGQELLRVDDPAPLGSGRVGIATYKSGRTQVRDIEARILPTGAEVKAEPDAVPDENEPDEKQPLPEPEPGKWLTLFDGKELKGWEPEGDAAFAVEDGALVARYGQGGGTLYLPREWDDFELRVVYRRLRPGSAGVVFRDGYRFDIATRAGHHSGSLHCRDKGFLASNPDGALEKPDDWNEAQVYAKGDHLMLWLNDRQVADVRDETFAGGRIGIDVARLGARELELAILRVDIRPLRPDAPPDDLKPKAPRPPEEDEPKGDGE